MFKFLLVVICCFFLLSTRAFAASPKPLISPTPMPQKTVDYVLPYPGILPDNALYKLKMVRDRIGAALIFDSLRRADYFLKMGDKRLAAAKFLADYGKWDLSAVTASKAEIYLLRSVEEAEKAKNSGKDVSSFLGRLSTASLKHEEVLTDLWGKAIDGPKQSFEKSKITTADVYKKAQELLGVSAKNGASPSAAPVKE